MHTTQLETLTQPLLRWAGSKRQLVSQLKEFWGDGYKRYVEPFAGSSALFFAIKPPKALLGDKNRELIETYQVLRRHASRLYQAVTAIPRSAQEYYAVRAKNVQQLSRFERAVRFVYLNRFCFNGLYRTNLDGRFNVPYAPTGTGGFPGLEQFKICARVLKNATLRPWDFGTTLRHTKSGDFVYLDPPYVVESRRVFREYGAGSFCERDLARLAEHLKKMDARGVAFLISYADCSEARSILSDWNHRRVRVRRNIAGFEKARRNAYEILAWNKG